MKVVERSRSPVNADSCTLDASIRQPVPELYHIVRQCENFFGMSTIRNAGVIYCAWKNSYKKQSRYMHSSTLKPRIYNMSNMRSHISHSGCEA
jgi:hypothetical protein